MKSSTKQKIRCRIAAFLIALTLILHWKIIFSLAPIANIKLYFYIVCTVIVYGLLNVLATIGLYKVKRWSYFVSYLAIIFSTVFFSVQYFPKMHFMYVVFAELPANLRSIPTIIINCLFFLYIIYIHVKDRSRK